ncbi:MAG: hypothetical protein ABIW16_04320 [Sphingomicrobium sp.]
MNGRDCRIGPALKGTTVTPRLLPLLLVVTLLPACARDKEFEDGGVFITRSACPQVAIPAATGDRTLFNPPTSRDASAIDVTATITNVIANCNDLGGERVLSNVGFDVVAVRSDAGAARQVVLPFFDVVVQGGSTIISKRIGYISLDFAAGSARAQTRTQAVARVSRAAASLPADVRKILTRRRRAGDAEAAVDPLTDPKVRDAVARATFEHLVGFQISQEDLRYNATR